MAQTKYNNTIIKQLWKDLQNALQVFNSNFFTSIRDAIIWNRFTEDQLLDVMLMYRNFMNQQSFIYRESYLRQGLNYWLDSNNKYNCSCLDSEIKKLMKLEAEVADWEAVPETTFEDLKTAVISMMEYDGSWEALYTTEEPPF